MRTYIGLDNGVSGSIGILTEKEIKLFKTPIKNELSYTKTKQNINRIDVPNLILLLQPFASPQTKLWIERPMVNPTRFKATMSAIRALEATLIALEILEMPYEYIDSKEWQKNLLPEGLKGEALKPASLNIGKRLFPSVDFKGFADADSLLIAEYQRRRDGTVKI